MDNRRFDQTEFWFKLNSENIVQNVTSFVDLTNIMVVQIMDNKIVVLFHAISGQQRNALEILMYGFMSPKIYQFSKFKLPHQCLKIRKIPDRPE